MITLLFVVLDQVLATGAPTDCPGCAQLPPSPSNEPAGACCYGSNWVKTTRRSDCEVLGFVWAGPYTDSASCKHLKPCCYTNNATCVNEVCFDCVKNGGSPIEKCEDCELLTTTTTTTRTKRTKPTHTTTTASTTTPSPTPADDGCCCFENGDEPELVSASACHERHGTYRGDGTTCEAEDVCVVKCCDTTTNTCVAGKRSRAECEAEPHNIFRGAGVCDTTTCGGRCCIAGRAVLSFSEQACSERGGLFQGFELPLDDAQCPRACCLPDEDGPLCAEMTESECTNRGGTAFLAGDTCRTVSCSGACCFNGPVIADDDDDDQDESSATFGGVRYGPPHCTIVPNDPSHPARENCEDAGGVYQGDNSICPFEMESSDSSTSSTDTTTSSRDQLIPNGQCLNDGACCLRDKEQGDENGCVRVGDISQCVARNGTFQGVGSRCTDLHMCKMSACCLGELGGCKNVHIERKIECTIAGGRYVGDGTTCELPGMCDHHSGACCCDGQCLNMPNATACYNYGGCSFRGTGTNCLHESVCEDHSHNEGACCIQNSYLEDGAQCVMMPTASACAFRGGVFRGKHTTCDVPDFTCGPLTGACCVDGIAYDDMTADECNRCGGTFAGPGSSSGDEGVCDVQHRGACCKQLHGCEDSTYAQCKRSGGNFQGPGSTCCDKGICSTCAPCHPEGFITSCQADTDCGEEEICVAQFGVCMVATTRINQKRVWNPTTHARAMRMGVVPLAKPVYTSVSKKTRHDEETSDEDEKDWHSKENQVPDGPFSCGSNATIGSPCIIHPCKGKCAIGVCATPPPNTVTGACQSLCLRIREYDCDCTCRDPWQSTCAFISGAVYNDTNGNNQLDLLGPVDALFVAEPVVINLFSMSEGDDDSVFVGSKTSTDGRFSFPQLPPGSYKVSLNVPEGYRVEDGKNSSRLVTVTCLPEPTEMLAKKRAAQAVGVHSQVLTAYDSKSLASHIVDNVYFLIAPGTEAEPSQQNGVVSDDASSSGSISGTVIAVIVVAAVLVCVAIAVFGFFGRQRVRQINLANRVPARTVVARNGTSRVPAQK